MKTSFYIAVSLSLIQLLFWLLSPFGGPVTIFRVIESGLYGGGDTQDTVLIANQLGISIGTFNTLNSIVAILYFGSLFFCSLALFLYKIRPVLKYKIGIILGIIPIVILLAGRLL